jgi:hypothetical protein
MAAIVYGKNILAKLSLASFSFEFQMLEVSGD